MVNNLKKIAFLDGIVEYKLQLLGNLFRYAIVEEVKEVFKEGHIGSELYIVSQGKVRVFSRDKEGKETQFGTVGSGSYFGEISLMV